MYAYENIHKTKNEHGPSFNWTTTPFPNHSLQIHDCWDKLTPTHQIKIKKRQLEIKENQKNSILLESVKFTLIRIHKFATKLQLAVIYTIDRRFKKILDSYWITSFPKHQITLSRERESRTIHWPAVLRNGRAVREVCSRQLVFT